MTFTLDISTDYTVWDDPEKVFFVQHADTGNVQHPISSAFRFKLTFREMAASGGVYTTQDRNWIIPKALFVPQPKPSDWLFDNLGTRWTVLSVDHEAFESVWRLTTRNLVLAHQLDDLVTIAAPVNSQDAAGSRTPTFVAVYQHVPARIQEISGESRDERGKRLTARQYTVYLGQRVTITQEHQLIDEATGDIYEIRSYSRPDLITDLQQLECERRGW